VPTRYVSPQPFEELDHTADAGLLVRGTTPDETLARLVLAFGAMLAGSCTVAACGGLTGQLESDAATTAVIAVEPGERQQVAVDLLRELLFRFEREGVIAVAVTVRRFEPESGATLEVGFAPYDPVAHVEGLVLKAVTHHAARFEPDGDGWLAQVVFDV
jgi:SHS2 domain-containing protein